MTRKNSEVRKCTCKSTKIDGKYMFDEKDKTEAIIHKV